MTEYRDPTSGGTGAAADQARDEARRVGDHAAGAAQDVADSARQEARQVAGEATDQIRALYDNALHEAMGHAATQQEKLAGQSRMVTDDLHRISRGERPESDLVNQLLSTVTARVEKFTTELESKEPADLLRDVRRFAARRPGAFLAVAAGIGLVAGRLTRGLSGSEDERDFDGRYRVPSAPGAYGPPPTSGPGAPSADEGPDVLSGDPVVGEGPQGAHARDPFSDPFTDPFGADLPEERR